FDLPRGVVHARDAFVRPQYPRLLEEPEVMIVWRPGDLQERRVRVAPLDLEAHHVAVEPHASLDARHPEHDVLQPLESGDGPGDAHRDPPSGYSTLTVIAAQAMRVSELGD